MKKAEGSKLTPDLIEQSRRVAAMRDEDIDLTDMPERLVWSNAVRGKFFRPVKQQVTLRLDADILHWFKAKRGGKRGYQTEINAALRKVVDGQRRKAR